MYREKSFKLGTFLNSKLWRIQSRKIDLYLRTHLGIGKSPQPVESFDLKEVIHHRSEEMCSTTSREMHMKYSWNGVTHPWKLHKTPTERNDSILISKYLNALLWRIWKDTIIFKVRKDLGQPSFSLICTALKEGTDCFNSKRIFCN